MTASVGYDNLLIVLFQIQLTSGPTCVNSLQPSLPDGASIFRLDCGQWMLLVVAICNMNRCGVWSAAVLTAAIWTNHEEFLCPKICGSSRNRPALILQTIRRKWCGHGVTIRTRLRSRSKDSKSTSNQVRLGTPAIIFGLSTLSCSTLADSSSTIRGLGLDRAENTYTRYCLGPFVLLCSTGLVEPQPVLSI